MYRRGQADAESDILNAFYYQHYQPYRRGYDETRRRLRRPGVATVRRGALVAGLLGLVAVAGGALLAWQRIQPPEAAVAPTVPTVVRSATPRATRTPILPTPTRTPTATPVPTLAAGIEAGRTVEIMTGGLRGRRDPSVDAPIVARFRLGEVATILEGPQLVDGYVWWRIEGPSGIGWSAQGSLEGDVWLRLVE
jgi:hypothetical protein